MKYILFFFSYELVVRAGTKNPRLINSIQKKILRNIPHPKYEGAFYFDVALIILEEVCFINTRIKDIGHGGLLNPTPLQFQKTMQKMTDVSNWKPLEGNMVNDLLIITHYMPFFTFCAII